MFWGLFFAMTWTLIMIKTYPVEIESSIFRSPESLRRPMAMGWCPLSLFCIIIFLSTTGPIFIFSWPIREGITQRVYALQCIYSQDTLFLEKSSSLLLGIDQTNWVYTGSKETKEGCTKILISWPSRGGG